MKNKNKLLIILTTIYIVIEAQAWIFLSSIYRHETTTTILSEYERFGYASAGLGVALIFGKLILQSDNNKIAKSILFVLITPIVYLLSVWGIYESVHKAPDLLPNSAKPLAMKASLYTLNYPDWRNLGVFYLNYTPKEHSLGDAVVDIQRNHASSERQIKAAYIHGLSTLNLFSEYYSKHADMVDKELLPHVINYARGAVYAEKNDQIIPRNTEAKWKKTMNWAESSYKNPVRWVELIYGIQAINEDDIALSTQVISILNSDMKLYLMGERKLSPNSYRDMKIGALIWEKLGGDFENWPNYNFNEDRISQFRRVYSRMVLDKYTYLPNTEIPWYNEKKDPLQSKEYMMAINQVVPFLFKDGKPLLTLSNVYDDKIVSEYTNNIKAKLPVLLKENWIRYQREAFTELSTNPNKWKEPTSNELNKDWLRLGFLAPLMLAISTILLVANVVYLVRANLILASVALASITILAFDFIPFLSATLLDLLLKISVKAPIVYLV